MDLSPAQNDRAVGALMGLAAGDALGAGYEFHTPGPSEPQMVGGGSFGWDPGEWTDDTQMAICIAEEAATGDLQPEAVGRRFLEWFRSGPADVGVQTSSILGRSASPENLADIALEYHRKRPDRSDGNGSLMRTAPVALASLDDEEQLWKLAQQVSALTHAGADSQEACALWSLAIASAIRQGPVIEDPGTALRTALTAGLQRLPNERREMWEERIDAGFSEPPQSFTPNGGAVGAFQAAISAISHTEVPRSFRCAHLSAALKEAVRIGGDTDTVATIAGGFLGAYWGQTAVPAMATGYLHGWPGYRATDLGRLGTLSVMKGEPDRSGWPESKQMLPYYDEHENEPGRWVRLEEEPNLVAGDVMALRHLGSDFDADVVVSLCRIGREDVPEGTNHHVVRMLDFYEPESNPNLEWVLVDLACSIDEWIRDGKSVFLHCVGANSRTPTTAAAFLAQRDGTPGREALTSVVQQLGSNFHNRYFGETLGKLWPDDVVELNKRRELYRRDWTTASLATSSLC